MRTKPSSATFPGGYTHRVYRYISALFFGILFCTRNRWKRRKEGKKGRFREKAEEGRRLIGGQVSDQGNTSRIE